MSREKGARVSAETSEAQAEAVERETNMPVETTQQNAAAVAQSQNLESQISEPDSPNIAQPDIDTPGFDASGFDAMPEPQAPPVAVISIRARAPTFLRIVNAQVVFYFLALSLLVKNLFSR